MPLPTGFQVSHEGMTILIAVSPTLTYRFPEPETRALAWSIRAECDVARRQRHLEARGD